MDNDRIKDIPSIKKIISDIKTSGMINDAMPTLEPILRLFGVDTSEMKDALAKIKDLEQKMDEFVNLPDKFNDLFSSRGWIMYDLMNVEVALAAVAKAEAGDIDGAEEDIVNYYDAKTVKWKLQTMIAVKAFRQRMELAQKALKDYEDERYYASILVVLALTDGLVSELSKERRGFASGDTNLQAWDSIAGHSKGLNTLARIFQTGRRTTRTEELSIPYRNGIMHGMDLGFDNKMVAAKTWAALFAVRDWALKAESGKLTAQSEPPAPTLSESLQQIQRTIKDVNMRRAWQPRDIVIGVTMPESGVPDDYDIESPERILIEFLSFWKARNYGKMAQHLTHKYKKYYGNKLPKKVSDYYKKRQLISYRIVEFESGSDGVNTSVIKVELAYTEDGQDKKIIKDVILLSEDDLGKTSMRGKEGHRWVIDSAYL